MTRLRDHSIAAIGVLALSATPGCSSSSKGGADDPDGGVTFTQLYAQIITPSCLPCHAPGMVGDSAGKLDMSTQSLAYTNLQTMAAGSSCASSDLKRVAPGDATMSLLYDKVSSTMPPCGEQMPYSCGGQTMCLASAQIQEIKDWIDEGAPND
jgi:hypothetical protein